MTAPVAIRPMRPADVADALAVARALPEWFNDAGLRQMEADLPRHDGAVAASGAEIVGFVTWSVSEEFGEITWIGVAPGRHRSGIGTRLIDHALDRLREAGVPEARVETLGESVDYEPYERTRAFYRKAGFRYLSSRMTDNPGMPESLWLHRPLGPG